MPQFIVISAVDKNLNANASSINPKTTFTVVNQPPDFGKECSHCGNIANSVNGNASAIPNPNRPINKEDPPTTNNVPIIGPVQEKETNASVNAMKKIPIFPPLLASVSDLFAHEEGNVISNKPKNDKANMTNTTKNNRLNQTFVLIAFKASEPKILVIIKPNET